jgi:class 3 adenylate cyclase
MPPEQIVEFLNDYFKLMVHEIFAEQGTLDKFMGDGIMAVFGAPISRPDDPVRAVRAALGMRRGLRRFNAQQRERGAVEIEIGIGISHGESISGNIGSEQRMEYTVIGDSVNIASRLEGLTKNYPYKILINDQIYEQVKDTFDCVLLGEEFVKGRAQAVPGVRRGRPRLRRPTPGAAARPTASTATASPRRSWPAPAHVHGCRPARLHAGTGSDRPRRPPASRRHDPGLARRAPPRPAD